MRTSLRRLPTTVLVAVVAFVMLGLGESGIGTAWPSVSRDVGRPLEDLGTLLVVGLTGYSASSAMSSRIAQRLGLGATTAVSALTSFAGLTLYATAGSWALVMLAAFVLGSGGGLLDSVLNAHAAHRFTPGGMNLLHAGFGIGATLGPIVMATAVASGAGWQMGYTLIAAAQLAILALLWHRRDTWGPPPVSAPRSRRFRFDGIVALSLAMFFLYTGIEFGAGQWSFSVLAEGRGFSTESAGAWVAAYWGGLTVGRLGLSAVATRLGPRRVLWWSMAGTMAAIGLFWWNPAGFGMWGLPMTGLSLAGIFPTLVTLTPQRLGPERTNAVVGYQLAAASIGAAALPWVIGRAIAASSLEAVAPFLAAGAVLMAGLNAVLDRRAAAPRAPQ